MIDLVYILSPSYSGSTLLTFLLNTHPEVSTIGELKAQALGDVETYECSCGTRMKECGFWQQVSAELTRQGVRFDPEDFGTHFRRRGQPVVDRVLRARVRGGAFEGARRLMLHTLPGTRKEFQAVLERNRLLTEVVGNLQRASMFLDGSKDPVRLQYMYEAGLWNVRVIYMVRDGRGTARSYMKHHGISMPEAAWEWRRTHEECDRLVARLPANCWTKVKYEDLCGAPDATLNDLFRFLRVDPAAANSDYRAVEHHIIGNSMWLKSSGAIRLDEKWRSDLGVETLSAFEKVAGELNRRYGYESPVAAEPCCA